MSYNNCQNPKCHYNSTIDRIRGSNPNKVYTTRKSTIYFGIACTLGCLNEFFEHHKEQIQRAIPPMPIQSRPINTVYNWQTKELENSQS
tara:strand:+ start:921 stop:1187 length:267 start_codon:yes stop_codon:yes gene_type:complete